MGSHTLNSVQILITMKYTALLLLGVLHSSQGLCFLNKCSSYWSNAKKNSTITGACAVLFDENCCKTGDTHFVIPRGGQGKMCGTLSGINPLSSCKGPRLEDDVESFIVMPGCTLEVWDESDGFEKQIQAEKDSANEGFVRNAKDLYNKEKLVLSAERDANWIEELNDDFNDMNEDISSYRCTCGGKKVEEEKEEEEEDELKT